MIPIIAAIVAATAAGIAAERRWPERAGHDSRRALLWILYLVLPPVTFFNLVHVSFDADLGGGIGLAWIATAVAAIAAWQAGLRLLDLTRPQVGAAIACDSPQGVEPGGGERRGPRGDESGSRALREQFVALGDLGTDRLRAEGPAVARRKDA